MNASNSGKFRSSRLVTVPSKKIGFSVTFQGVKWIRFVHSRFTFKLLVPNDFSVPCHLESASPPNPKKSKLESLDMSGFKSWTRVVVPGARNGHPAVTIHKTLFSDSVKLGWMDDVLPF